ncbi:hypothetical protein CANCADRAFT_134608 [Tortispora caseinolytica NRRL Y-17796]|uniref:Uncharacterized protein n=1 Tax=Tortispora caseinolytica NRRL Y-17796 TaxID=767744 RepID=A0A1E4TBQ0_9ASCO|nr:hypothetical protein CANCADRAFT_134608 [Tortispora caseinolytica NRRL Y-17796]
MKIQTCRAYHLGCPCLFILTSPPSRCDKVAFTLSVNVCANRIRNFNKSNFEETKTMHDACPEKKERKMNNFCL